MLYTMRSILIIINAIINKFELVSYNQHIKIERDSVAQ